MCVCVCVCVCISSKFVIWLHSVVVRMTYMTFYTLPIDASVRASVQDVSQVQQKQHKHCESGSYYFTEATEEGFP